MYAPPPSVGGIWSQPRRNHDEEYATARDHRRHNTDYHNDGKHHEFDSYRVDRLHDNYHATDSYYESGSRPDFGVDRSKRIGSRESAEFHGEFEDRYHSSNQSRDDSYERDHEYGHYDYDSDHERGRRDSSWKRRDSCESKRERSGLSREREESPYMRHSRSRSHGRDDRSRSWSRSRSPRARSHGRNQRDGLYDDNRFDRRREYDWDDRRHGDSVAPSATVVVKGLSMKTNDDDLYQILSQWGPLRSVRVIKERNSGMSRGFAFIDFSTVEAACRMMEATGKSGLQIDGRNVFFQYSSKPTGVMGGSSPGQENLTRPTYGPRTVAALCDWICSICGCMNFARRTSCFQCNEPRAEDALPADATGSSPHFGRKGSELGPTHVLVVRGLDENADEEMLRYEFAKHAPLKDIRLVRDKFTHVSRGFAFVHFHSVEDATKALEATNGITLEKNGQVLRVAYAKSTHGPASGGSQSNSLAAAAIEAASFAQQYDAIGWAPKEYNPDDKQNSNFESQKDDGSGTAQSGFVWDEKSGYYYDSASGFYYDGTTGLYYDSNSGVWYSYDQQTQQYVPCTDQSNTKAAGETSSENMISDSICGKKVVISAPAATIKQNKKTSLPDAVQAAANAALAAEKREKEKAKEIKLASKSSLIANKKKMNNVLAMWKQRNQEGQAARIVIDDKEPPNSDDRFNHSHSGTGFSSKSKPNFEFENAMDNSVRQGIASTQMLDSDVKPRPVSNSLGTTVMGVIRGSTRGVIKSDTTFHALSDAGSTDSRTTIITRSNGLMTSPVELVTPAPYKTDVSALVSNTSSGVSGSGKRRFSEAPGQSQYRDRAAERRNLYGSSLRTDAVGLDSTGHYPSRKGPSEIGSMPFPPGVGERSNGEIGNNENYEVITADSAIDESNVGNRILRNMGWQEGLGLGKDGSGIKEPVQAKSVDVRAGLGSQQRKADPILEAKAGDSYKTIIQKKAMARFKEMS
ncbi:SUPPRESSOR OF ABI3-5 [Zea mays]|uniref:SUPPRESSOR OF ABI3-5 n=4 Tax=Zea mays TaxID=4577 RepID=A0A1D6G3J9_MAIZE|nr:SUPPRESSOR OF ABI3-5 [Zea mays]AQK97907.1 SUPPRESSOR OF ABI3-5 [Zea mays]AQK97908.1 SUPPRESSOR OF ABI3-5 [Zea mays]